MTNNIEKLPDNTKIFPGYDDEKENLEAQWSNVNLAEMVVLNDMKRVKLLLEDNEKEASEVATENYSKRKKKSNPKVQCDADLCFNILIK